jgi:putative (di)nucleoside polyphosphate hydrolase
MDRDSDYIDADGYRANVGIILMNDDRQVFIGGRVNARGWQFPQGGIRRGERPEQALYRELAEEVGLRPGQVVEVARTKSWLRYRLPPQFVRRDSTPLCIGQKQRWYLLKLGAEDSALRFDATEQPPEFDRWRWVDWWDAVHDVIYFKRRTNSVHRPFPRDCRLTRRGGRSASAPPRRKRALESERPGDGEQHDADQQQRRHFVEPAVPARTAGVAARSEIPQQPPVPGVVSDEEQDQGELYAHPARLEQRRIAGEQPESEQRRQCGPDRHEHEQAALHDAEPLDARAVRRRGVVYEQARQVKETREPGHHEDHMPGLDPGHRRTLPFVGRF